MVTINDIINVKDSQLINGLVPAINIMSKVQNDNSEDFIIDLSNCQFTSSVFLLSLLLYVRSSEKKFQFQNPSTYLNTIRFPKGLKPDTMRSSEFIAELEGYSKKSYIPLIDFPTQSSSDAKEGILSAVESLIMRQISLSTNIAEGLKYLIGETIDNITEHSDSERGYIVAQNYPSKKYLDICISDNGVSLLGSYKRLSDNEISSDLEAIQAANRRISSKNRPDAENRGYGIYTSKNMTVNGLKGQYMMCSGNAFYFKTSEHEEFYTIPDKLKWNGTIVAFRISSQMDGFNYVNYIE